MDSHTPIRDGERISLKSILTEIFSVLNFERGILYSLREITLRPRMFVGSYMEGERQKSVNPYRFLFLTTALVVFLSLNFVFISDRFEVQATTNENGNVNISFGPTTEDSVPLKEMVDGLENKSEQESLLSFLDRLSSFFNSWLNSLFLLLVPIQAFFSYLFFRKRNWNYAEHFTANAFFFAWANIIFILAMPLMLWKANIVLIVLSVMGIGAMLLTFRVFRTKRWFQSFLAALGVAMLTAFSTLILISLVLSVTIAPSVN